MGGGHPNSAIMGEKDKEHRELLSSMLANATSLSEQAAIVADGFQQKLSSELGIEKEALDMENTTYEIGG